jgi:hypothetical protein
VLGKARSCARPTLIMVELATWVAHRQRRVMVRTALKNQLLGQVDRVVPGLGGCIVRGVGEPGFLAWCCASSPTLAGWRG